MHEIMTWHDLAAIALIFLVSLGGGGAIVLGLANWIGKILANKNLEKLRHEIQEELETHKTRLRKSEFLFQKEFDAASAFISLRLRLLPNYRIPEMDWHDACEDFARDFEDVVKALEGYMAPPTAPPCSRRRSGVYPTPRQEPRGASLKLRMATYPERLQNTPEK